jgi:hypothetical protein
MDGVKPFRLLPCQMQSAHRADGKTGLLDAVQNPTRQSTFDGVRLDDRQRSFGHDRV